MQFGFAKHDITPRLGVELCGFGPFINRRALAVRDRLWARAMAVRQGDTTLVIVSNDLAGVSPEVTTLTRQFVREETDLPDDAIMVHCTHTHSGPAIFTVNGWGAIDMPYVETLPRRIARAAVDAVMNLQEATISYAAAPCEGISLNREYDRDAPPLDEVLRDDWRPAKPELTDTTTHVFTVEADGQRIGFLSYFGCHPVTCCQETHYIHGDFAGVATNRWSASILAASASSCRARWAIRIPAWCTSRRRTRCWHWTSSPPATRTRCARACAARSRWQRITWFTTQCPSHQAA